jgi:Restriction endonuclease XhoI
MESNRSRWRPPLDIDKRLQNAVQQYWDARSNNKKKQVEAGKIDAGTRGEVTGGTQMGALEILVADILCEAGLDRLHVKTRSALELPGYFRATKKWDLIVVTEQEQLVLAMEFKSQAGKSIGNNINNRAEEAVGSAKDIWIAYREGRFGKNPAPFLGYFFLLEDRASVKSPIKNKEPYFKVDPAFRGEGSTNNKGGETYQGVSYRERYELLCRRLMRERLYNAACFITATNVKKTVISQPAEDLDFQRFAAALRGHAMTFLGSRKT